MTGARVGNWYLDREVGRTAGGAGYVARQYGDPDHKAAVTVLDDPRTADPAFLARFPADMLGLHRLDHPNVVRFYEAGVHAGRAWYAAEWVDAPDAATLLEGGRRPWREAFAVAVQAARALKHGHLRGTLHRDLRPAHFLIAPDGALKLAAFGLAKVVPPETSDAGRVLGPAAYLPPEAAGGKPLTRRSDFYSLGGVLYTLVTGRPPFAAATLVELTHKVCYALPERPALLVPDLPAEFDELIRGLLDKNPARRPASAAALLADLDRVRGKLDRKGFKLVVPADPGDKPADAVAEEAEGVSPDGRPGGRPQRLRVALFAGLFLLAGAGLAVPFLWPKPDADALFAAAQPLLNSDDPADWDRAWDESLEPLARHFPDRYADEVTAAKARIQDRRELRRALAVGAKADPRTDAERGYLRGLRLAQAGDPDAARTAWHAVETAFAGVESEKRWVDLSRDGLASLDKPDAKHTKPPPDRRPFRAALDHARELAKAGKTAEATAAFAALEELFQGDAEARAAIRDAMAGK